MTSKSTCEQVTIREWPRSNRETIRVTVGLFQGNPVFSIRAWYAAPDGEQRPSRDGITLSLKHLAPLLDTLADAYERACRSGFIDPEGKHDGLS